MSLSLNTAVVGEDERLAPMLPSVKVVSGRSTARAGGHRAAVTGAERQLACAQSHAREVVGARLHGLSVSFVQRSTAPSRM
jgi:hypothetical protein